MNVIKTGTSVRIFDESVEVADRIEPAVYAVEESRMGLYLRKTEVAVATDRIYGDSMKPLDKILRTYKGADRNLGVILSGDKGIGKTMFTKLVMQKALADNIPVITVNAQYNGLADFIGSIRQDCVVVFDEFDKTFVINDNRANDVTAGQNDLLTLFDGIIPGHKMFVITCNDIEKVSSFLVNRPGRFRYHLRFDYPDETAVREFLRDKVGDALRPEDEDSVVRFSNLVPQSYDCLTAIAEELKSGETFRSAMQILNIVNLSSEDKYTVGVVLEFANGKKVSVNVDYDEWIDFFDESAENSRKRMDHVVIYMSTLRDVGIDISGIEGADSACVRIPVADIMYSINDVRKSAKYIQGKFILMDNFDVTYAKPSAKGPSFTDSILGRIREAGGFKVAAITLEKSSYKNIRYTL